MHYFQSFFFFWYKGRVYVKVYSFEYGCPNVPAPFMKEPILSLAKTLSFSQKLVVLLCIGQYQDFLLCFIDLYVHSFAKTHTVSITVVFCFVLF